MNRLIVRHELSPHLNYQVAGGELLNSAKVVLFRMICMKCGRDNVSNGSTYCSYCNAKLPSSSFMDVMSTPKYETSRLNDVTQYCDCILAGTVSMEDFANYISLTYEHLAGLSAGIYQTVEEDAYSEVANDEVESGFEGMQLWESGLSEIYAYTEDMDEAHIKNGLDMVRRGNDLINKAMIMNRNSRSIDGVHGTL